MTYRITNCDSLVPKTMYILQVLLKAFIALSILVNTDVFCKQSRSIDKYLGNIFREFYLKSGGRSSGIKFNFLVNITVKRKRLEIRSHDTDFHKKFHSLTKFSQTKTIYQDENISLVTNEMNGKNKSFWNISKIGKTVNKSRLRTLKPGIFQNSLSTWNQFGLADDSFLGMRVRRDATGCLNTGSCEHNMNKDIPVCYCDIACNIFNDCCHNNKVNVETLEIEQLVSDMKLNFISCLKVRPGQLRDLLGYYMVSICPDNTTELEDKKNCSKTQSRHEIPVLGVDGLTYKNEHCARCHGVRKFIRWSIRYELDCDVTVNEISKHNAFSDKVKFLQAANCLPDVFPPADVPRPRVCWEVGSNPEKPKIMLNMTECLRYQNPVIVDRIRTARNIFCFDEKIANISSDFCTLPVKDASSKYAVRSLSVLFEFNKIPKSNDDNKKEDTSEIDVIIQNYQFNLGLKLCSNATVNGTFLRRVLKIIYSVLKSTMPWKIKNTFHGESAYKYSNFSDNLRNGSEKFTCLNCFDINATIFLDLTEEITLREIADFDKTFDKIEWTYIERYQSGSSINKFSITVIRSGFVTIKNYHYNYAYIRFRGNKEELKFLQRFYQQISLLRKRIHFGIPQRLDLTGLLECNKSGENDDIICYHIDAIVFNSETAGDETAESSILQENNMISGPGNTAYIEIILTYVFIGLSSVSLLVAMVIQKHLKLTVNNAGKISQNLMGCMILSYLFFIFGSGANDNNDVCLAIGIISHYIWLCFFTWMGIYSAMIIQAVRKETLERVNVEGLPFYVYIIGYGSPLLTVVSSVILDLTTEIKIGYADEVCFPSVYPTNIVVFITPVSISIVINAIVLTIAGRHIRNRRKDIGNLSNNIQTRLYWPVYFRLVVFSGLSWLLGILAEATGIDFIRFVFLCSAGLHGFFFSVSYLTSKQVLVEFKKERLRKTNSAEKKIQSNT